MTHPGYDHTCTLPCFVHAGRLIIDLMNEPDLYGASWNNGGALPSSLADYYLAAMEALNPICPDCLFQIQGSGERQLLSSLWMVL